jgi:hypothetical protein
MSSLPPRDLTTCRPFGGRPAGLSGTLSLYATWFLTLSTPQAELHYGDGQHPALGSGRIQKGLYPESKIVYYTPLAFQ